MNVGIAQFAMSSDLAVNLDRAEAHIEQLAGDGADVICLPELFASRYFCQTENPDHYALAEAVPGPTTERFEAVARKLDVALVLSLFEQRAPGLYHNTAAVIDGPRGYLGKYRKMHIPDDPRYYEKYYFTPGDMGFRTFDLRVGRIGVLICWDQWYPEAARLTALRGAEVLFYPTAIGWHPEEKDSHGVQQHGAWETIQRSHAVANGCFVVSVNRTGFEPEPGGSADEGIQFWGQSFAVGPDGAVLERLPESGESTAVVSLDLDLMAEQRHGWPFLRDRRIDAYGELASRWLDD
ncbi:MAG: carbon-nitrogen hydrolase [Rhodothermales bacterium]|nr:carbon-nitrogen hydrolase [Rhodothermales bacterium]